MTKRGFQFTMSEVLLRNILFEAMGLDETKGEICDISMITSDHIRIFIEGEDERFPKLESGFQEKTPVIMKRDGIVSFIGFSEDMKVGE